MRLIDADELIKEFETNGTYWEQSRLEEAPTVDAVPVVRCKNCKYRFTILCPTYSIEYDMENEADVMWGIAEDDGFCSHGKAIK